MSSFFRLRYQPSTKDPWGQEKFGLREGLGVWVLGFKGFGGFRGFRGFRALGFRGLSFGVWVKVQGSGFKAGGSRFRI